MSELEPSAAHSLSLPQSGKSLPISRMARDAWLREVEHARWEAQPRYQGAEGAADGSGGELPFADTSAKLLKAGTSAAADAVRGVPAAAGGGTQRVWCTDDSRETLDTTPGRLWGAQSSSHLQPVPTRVEPKPLVGGDCLEMVQTRTPAQPRQAALKAQWQPYALHVERNDEEIAVWLRDAHLGTQDALSLLDRLSQVFSGSTSAGRALRLTVNGQPVSRGDVPRHESEGEGIRDGN